VNHAVRRAPTPRAPGDRPVRADESVTQQVYGVYMPSASGPTVTGRRSETATRILAAAADLLETGGTEAVTMRKLAARVGVTPMALYRHFSDREALLAAVADDAFARLGAEWSEVAWSGDPDDDLDNALERYLDFAMARPRLYAFLFVDPRGEARRFPEDFADHASPTLRLIVKALSAGMLSGKLRDDDPLECALLIAAELQGLVAMYLGGRIAMTQPELRSLCARQLHRVLAGLRA
jgi:AcrR family transcriptional regulator